MPLVFLHVTRKVKGEMEPISLEIIREPTLKVVIRINMSNYETSLETRPISNDDKDKKVLPLEARRRVVFL